MYLVTTSPLCIIMWNLLHMIPWDLWLLLHCVSSCDIYFTWYHVTCNYFSTVYPHVACTSVDTVDSISPLCIFKWHVLHLITSGFYFSIVYPPVRPTYASFDTKWFLLLHCVSFSDLTLTVVFHRCASSHRVAVRAALPHCVSLHYQTLAWSCSTVYLALT